MPPEPATILGSEMRHMESRYTGRKYRITVSLPYAYSKPRVEGWPFDDAPARWPVVYLLDGNWFSGMVTDIVRSVAWCGGTSDAIVVGIGFPEDEDPQEAWREAMARRNLEFTPVRSEAREQRMEGFAKRPVQTGSAGSFHQFIRDELIPVIEQEYRADPSKRILVSHSLGADFAAFALFKEPELFETYIMVSLGPGEYDPFKDEEAFAKEHKKLPAKIHLSVGELEESIDNTTLTGTLRFAAILESRRYEGLSLVKHVFIDRNHCEVVAPALQAGLMFALQKSS